MLQLFLQSRPPVDVCLSCNWCWRCRSVKSIWHSSDQFWTQSKQFQTLSSLENGSDSKYSHTHKKFQTLSSLESWSDSKCITLTNNSKCYPVWRIGQIPSASHSQTIPNPIHFGDWVGFQVGHTGGHFQFGKLGQIPSTLHWQSKAL